MPSAGGGPGGPQYIIQLFVRGRIFDKHRDYGTQGLSYTFSTPAGARLGVLFGICHFSEIHVSGV